MDDEEQQIRQELFDQILVGLGLLGLVGGLIALGVEGLGSPWFLRAMALLVVILVAYLLHRSGHYVVAAYVLVLELAGLVIGLYFQATTLKEPVPYLFIPIIIITGLILEPHFSIMLAFFVIGLVTIILAITDQFSLAALSQLISPFALLLVTSLLVNLGGHYLVKLSRRLNISKNFLRERTLELLKIQADIETLQKNLLELKTQLLKAKTETSQIRHQAVEKDSRLHHLIEGTVREVSLAVKGLEQVIETISDQPYPAQQTNLLHLAWQQIDHLTGLTINLQELIRLEGDDLILNYQLVDLSRLINELIGSAQSLALEKNLQLRYNLPDSLPPVPADPDRLRQALLYLLTTSVAWTEQGLIEIQAEQKQQEVVIYISDTGHGISTDELNAILHNFEQGYQTANLGVTISKRLVELHGGRLWATSVPGVGSTFYVALPLNSNPDQTQLSLKPVTVTAVNGGSYQNQPVTAKAPRPQTAPIPTLPPTLVSAKNAPPRPQPTPSTQANLGPVARYSPVYITRFGLILLGLLVVVTLLIITLAVANGPNPSQTLIDLPTPPALPSATPTKIAPVAQVNPSTSTPQPTATATPLPPTPIPQSTATAIPLATTPASTATPQPTTGTQPTAPLAIENTPTATLAPTLIPLLAFPTATPVYIVLTPTPTLTTNATPIFLISLTQTLTPTSISILTPTPTAIQMQPLPSPTAPPTPLTPPDLSFITTPVGFSALNLLEFNNASGLSLAAVNQTTDTYPGSPPAVYGQQAVILKDSNGERDLYLAQPGDTPPLNLTASPGDDLQPAWSPDGRRMAFSSGRNGNLDIYVMDVAEKNLAQLTTSRGFDEWPAWSPDGRQLAFVSDRDGNVEIYIMDADGQNQQRLTDHPADDWPVAWSPDARRLVFASNRDGNWNLFMIEADGANLTRLTSDPADERDPIWSPDGRTIAFAHNGGGNWDIYTLPAPTGPTAEIPSTAWRQITRTPTDERYPTWLR